MNFIKKRILEISYKNQLSHLSSCLTSADLIDQVLQVKKPDEPFILSNGHAGVALYAALEKNLMGIMPNAEQLFKKHGVHPNRDEMNWIDCSTGSLGHGLPIGVGMALSDRKKNVYVLTSDGEWMEGSMWEALRIAADKQLDNLVIYINANGFSAYDTIDLDRMQWRIGAFVKNGCPKIAFLRTNYDDYPFLKGIGAHYKVLSKEEYEKI